MSPITFGIVGAGWRTEFYLRLAHVLPDRFEVTGVVVRNAAKAQSFERQWGVRVFATLEAMLKATTPAFVVSCVKWTDNHLIVTSLAERGVPALSETPLAPDVDGLVRVHGLVEKGARIQVAEQYWLQPLHAARLAVIAKGLLGAVSQAQVSVAHGFHGMSLMRKFLGIQYESATLEARRFTSPIVAGPDRGGPPATERVTPSTQHFIRLDFGDRLGLFDFTGDQYFSWIRGERLLIRGERGEILQQQVSYLKDSRHPIRAEFIRHAAGANGNLEGLYLKGIQVGEDWVYDNPLAPARLSDDEIAVGTCLLRMDEYLRTGKDFYSAAEAFQDQYLSLLSEEALKRGAPVRAERMPWV